MKESRMSSTFNSIIFQSQSKFQNSSKKPLNRKIANKIVNPCLHDAFNISISISSGSATEVSECNATFMYLLNKQKGSSKSLHSKVKVCF